MGTQRNEESTTEIKEQIVAETNIKITADTRQAERDIKRLETALDGINSVGDGAATALAAITAAAAGMGYAILKTLDAAGALIDASKALGISAQNLQVLQHAAALAGVGAEELNGSLIRLQNNLGSAFAAGTGPAIDAMKRLGIPMETIMAMRVDKQFESIANELNKITNPAERNALAIDLLGKQGPRLLELANNTKTAREEMEKLGLALSDIDVAALDAAGDSVDELKGIFDAGLKKAVAEISPYIVAIVRDIKDAITEAGGFEVVWQRIKDAIKLALNIAVFTAAIFALSRMVAFAVGLTTAIRAAGVAMGLFNAVVMKNPLMLAVGAALLLAKVLGIDVVGAVTDSLFPAEKMAAITTETATNAEKIKKTNEAAVVVSKEANKEQQKALDALKESLSKLEQSVKFEQDKVKLGEAQANINKMIAEESAKLEKVGKSLSDKDKQRITDGYLALEAIKQQTSMTKTLEGLETERLSITTTDKDLKEVVLAIRKQELEFNRKLTNEESESLRIGIQKNQLAKQSVALAEQQLLLQGLAKDLSKEDSIRTATGVVAQNDPRLAMAQDYETKKKAIDQSIAEESKKIDDGSYNAYRQLVDARTNLDQEYRNAKEIADLQFNDRDLLRSQGHEEAKFQHKLKVLQAGYEAANSGVLQEKRIMDQSLQNEIALATAKIQVANREVLARQAIGEAILSMEQKVADARLKQAGVTNQAILDSVKQNQANVAMIQQGGVVGAQGMLGALMSVTGQMSQTSRKAFEAHKAAAMAQAIISTYQAAAMAIAFPPGPPLSFIYVAGAIAAGLAQVAQIRSQQFSGRALGGPVMGGKPYIVGESGPELFTPSTTGNITRNSDLQGGGVTNVNFTIVANDTTGFDQLLASRKGVIQQIISDAMLEKGRRSMV